MSDLSILNSDVPEDRDDWVDTLSGLPRVEPQLHPAYCWMVRPSGASTLCASYSGPHGKVLMPFHTRPIDGATAAPAIDAITPYGYGGPYRFGEVDAGDFWQKWDAWARKKGVVSLVVRRHLFEEDLLSVPGERFRVLRNVVVDVSKAPAVLWEEFEGRVRTDARRAMKADLELLVDIDCVRFDDFYHLYLETMRRNSADPYFLFDRDSLLSVTTQMQGQVILCLAILDGNPIAAEMQLLGGEHAYYFLSGMSLEARELRAGQALKIKVIDWLHEHGYKQYILGGGIRDDDGLFKYKRSYAPKGLLPFEVSYHELDSQLARELVYQRRKSEPDWHPKPGFLPRYRA